MTSIDKILRFLLNSQVVKFVIGSSSVKHGERLLSDILDEMGIQGDTVLAQVRQDHAKSEMMSETLTEYRNGIANGRFLAGCGMAIVDARETDNETGYLTGGHPEQFHAASRSITVDSNLYYDFGTRPLLNKYTAVTPDGTENPSEEGWYVSDGNDGYELSEDATVVSGTTYYERGYGSSGLALFPKAQPTDDRKAYSYAGRFQVAEGYSGDFQFGLISARKNLVGVVLEGGEFFTFNVIDVPEFEPGHIYEYNILYDTCIIKDITPVLG